MFFFSVGTVVQWWGLCISCSEPWVLLTALNGNFFLLVINEEQYKLWKHAEKIFTKETYTSALAERACAHPVLALNGS